MPTKNIKRIYRLIFSVGCEPMEEWYTSRHHAVKRQMELTAEYAGEGHTSHSIDSFEVQISAKGICKMLNMIIDHHCLNEH
jgi:hypothetical protein